MLTFSNVCTQWDSTFILLFCFEESFQLMDISVLFFQLLRLIFFLAAAVVHLERNVLRCMAKRSSCFSAAVRLLLVDLLFYFFWFFIYLFIFKFFPLFPCFCLLFFASLENILRVAATDQINCAVQNTPSDWSLRLTNESSGWFAPVLFTLFIWTEFCCILSHQCVDIDTICDAVLHTNLNRWTAILSGILEWKQDITPILLLHFTFRCIRKEEQSWRVCEIKPRILFVNYFPFKRAISSKLMLFSRFDNEVSWLLRWDLLWGHLVAFSEWTTWIRWTRSCRSDHHSVALARLHCRSFPPSTESRGRNHETFYVCCNI